MKGKKLVVIILGLLFATSSAIGCNLGISQISLSVDSLQYGDTLDITTYIVNYDNVTYTGPIDFAYSLNGVQNINSRIFTNELGGQSVTIAPGDSVAVLMHIIITPSYFIAGPDILVVWPLCPAGSPPHNYLRNEIFVIDQTATGIGDDPLSPSSVRVYSAASSIWVCDKNNENLLNRVIIYNLYGQQISASNCSNAITEIYMANQPTGIYLVEAILSDNRRLVFKVFR